MRLSRFAICALVLASGCHHKSVSAPPIDAFYAEVAAAQATLAVCELGLAPSTAASLYALSEDEELALAQATAAYSAGKLKFDLADSQSCLRELVPPATCWGPSASVQALLLAQPADCLDAIQGTVLDGGPCDIDLECADGSCNTAACPGACVPGAAVGAACTASEECASGLICNVNVCAPPGALGNDCKKNNDCDPGTVCITTITRANGGPLTPDGVCSAPIAAGGDCDPEYANTCASGFYCLPTVGSTTDGTCTAQVAAGGVCTMGHGPTGFTEALESAQCVGHQVCAGLIVDSNGNVTTPGHCDVPHDIGGACVATGVAATQGCYLGLICDGTGMCIAPPKVGEPCATPPSDNSGLTVDYCVPGAYCDSPGNGGNCQAKLADGASGCQGNTSCLSGACDSSSFTCASATPGACSATP